MSAPARWPSAPDPVTTTAERLLADCAESFKATTGLDDGTRSLQIVTWTKVLTAAVNGVVRREQVAA